MENFSINFLIKETKKTLLPEIFINKVKLKKEFLVLITKEKNIFFPIVPESPPFFLSGKKPSGEDYQSHDINVYRKYLENSFLIDIDKPFYERVIFFKFKKTMIWGEEKNFYFIVNCSTLPVKWFIANENKRIIFSKNDNDFIAGNEFTLPESDKEEPLLEKMLEFTTLSPREFARKFKGFSTNYAKEFINSKDKKGFWEKILNCEMDGGFQYKKDCYPIKMESLSPEIKIFPSFNQCIEDRFFNLLNIKKIQSLKKGLERKLKKEIAKKEKLLKKMHLELKDAKKGEELIKKAQILSSNFNKLKKGMKKVTVLDFFKNKEIEIELNPELSPKENVSRLYRKATRLKRKLPFVKERIKELKAEILNLKDSLFLIENAHSLELLEEFEGKGLKKEKEKDKTYSGIEKIEIGNGFFVYVGKNSKANHILYTRKLSKNDLWFHAKDIPGSHVVLKNPRNLPIEEIPIEVIEKAASIAAFYSKGRNNTIVEVQYTTKDKLYSSKGKGAGFVLLRDFKTILVKPSNWNENNEKNF